MHIEVLVEDSSGEKLLQVLLPQLLGPQGEPHTWRLHAYKGIGRIPKGLVPNTDAAKRILLDRLPKQLRGYGKTPGIDAVVIVLDTDKRDCAAFLAELIAAKNACNPSPNTLFRLAIEEMEAWYFGDQDALLAAYPSAKCSESMFRIAYAIRGNISPMRCILADQPRSRKQAGHCLGR